MSLVRVISLFANIIRGRNYYGRYKKMYGRDLRKIPSFKLISRLAYGKVLDIGCGIGYLSILFDNYVGIDISREALTIARKNTNGNYIIASANNLPFRPDSFDTCISYDFIEHAKNIEQVLAEMKCVAHKIVLSCVDFGSYYRFFAYDATHVNPLTPDRLILLLKNHFANVTLFKTSGLFKAPKFINVLLAKYFPNQVVAECLSEINSTITG
jgi:ubiquinone/menaquinone biosynthesis C-methylase UbiE